MWEELLGAMLPNVVAHYRASGNTVNLHPVATDPVIAVPESAGRRLDNQFFAG
jgi:hypothetical protein